MGWLGRRIAEVQIAVMLLTRLPAGSVSSYVPSLAAARWAFPLIGLIIGTLIALSYYGASLIGLPPMIAALIALCLGLLATGAMHEDGLADSADGFGGGHDRKRKLAIMKDSHIGTYGVLALIMVMVTRLIAISSLPAITDIIWPLISCAVFSRLIMVFYLSLLPSARTDGLGDKASGRTMTGIIIALLISAPMLYLAGAPILPSLILMSLVAMAFALLALRQIGGQTGDVCGAGQILCETAGWISLISLF